MSGPTPAARAKRRDSRGSWYNTSVQIARESKMPVRKSALAPCFAAAAVRLRKPRTQGQGRARRDGGHAARELAPAAVRLARRLRTALQRNHGSSARRGSGAGATPLP